MPLTAPIALVQAEAALAAGKITASAVGNLKNWLTEARYAEYLPEVLAHIERGEWQRLDDVFWTIIPFGTGGRRGRMYPIGANAINDRTIGESAQGLAEYVKATLGPGTKLSCAIARDTRHKSDHFAELCAEIMVANGFTVYFLRGFRSTPELSFAVRYKHCSCGIMVTASHNPPSDNAVKVYWSTGGQVLPPHDAGIIERVMNCQQIQRTNFTEALAAGKVIPCEEEVDSAFLSAVMTQATPGPRDLKILYSPLHGVGATAVLPVLERDGFQNVELFSLHAEPNGDFPNVPGQVSNPENPRVFDSLIEHARITGGDLCVATDPDCDRIGLAAARSSKNPKEIATLTGNQICALLCDFVLETRKKQGGLSPDNYVVTTLVTTQLVRRIAESYGVRTIGDLLVGFKWIAGAIDEFGPEKFLYGTEESHGYMAGSYVRDKDGAVAAMLACELAASLKVQKQTLHEKLESLFWQHGCHVEQTINVQMPGSEGMGRMKQVMQAFRNAPPASLGGVAVKRIRDYGASQQWTLEGPKTALTGPVGDLVMLDLAEEGNYVAARPSGTEPKIKFYLFGFTPPEQLHDLEVAQDELNARLAAIDADLRKFAGV